jgi:hypothetical protein
MIHERDGWKWIPVDYLRQCASIRLIRALNVEMGLKSYRRANRRVLVREEVLAGEGGNVLGDEDEFLRSGHGLNPALAQAAISCANAIPLSCLRE